MGFMLVKSTQGAGLIGDAAFDFLLIISMPSFEVLPFTTLASSVNGKTSKKSMQKRRGGFRCVKTLKAKLACHPARCLIIERCGLATGPATVELLQY